MLKIFIYTLLVFLTLTGCKKFLDAKADKSMFVLSKLAELQGLFDHQTTYTTFPSTGLLAADDGYFSSANYNSMFYIWEQNAYVWHPDTDLSTDWEACYKKIFKMNVIIEELHKLSSDGNSQEANQILGSALFMRAKNHFDLAQLFAAPYHFRDADPVPGIPLKMAAEIEDATARASLRETYNSIISDFKASAGLLPDTGFVKTRPSKTAAYGLLARVYLQIGEYEMAEKYADSSISIYSRLLNFNDSSRLQLGSAVTFAMFNQEVVFHSTSRSVSFLSVFYADSTLIQSYPPDDLRKPAFFIRVNEGIYRFKGGYNGARADVTFTGISTNEIRLIRAEARARNNKVALAMSDLNTLLANRWKNGTYINKVANSQEQSLDTILSERRKELCFRPSIRWSDLRRLNREPKYVRTLTRNVNGTTIRLLPDDKRYTFLIPARVIAMNNIEQNPR